MTNSKSRARKSTAERADVALTRNRLDGLAEVERYYKFYKIIYNFSKLYVRLPNDIDIHFLSLSSFEFDHFRWCTTTTT